MMEKINNMGGTGEPAGESGVPCCFAWAAIHQVFKLLGNLFLYPFSHVVELWPGRPVGKGNGLSVYFLRGTGFISFSRRLSEDYNEPGTLARTGKEEPNNCWFDSGLHSCYGWSSMSLWKVNIGKNRGTRLTVCLKKYCICCLLECSSLCTTCAFLKITSCSHACNDCKYQRQT